MNPGARRDPLKRVNHTAGVDPRPLESAPFHHREVPPYPISKGGFLTHIQRDYPVVASHPEAPWRRHRGLPIGVPPGTDNARSGFIGVRFPNSLRKSHWLYQTRAAGAHLGSAAAPGLHGRFRPRAPPSEHGSRNVPRRPFTATTRRVLRAVGSLRTGRCRTRRTAVGPPQRCAPVRRCGPPATQQPDSRGFRV